MMSAGLTHQDALIERYFAGKPFRPAERDALFGHLDRCDRCRRRFDEQAYAHRALSGAEGPSVSELSAIGASIIDEAVFTERRRAPSVPSWVTALTASLALFAAVIFLGREPAEMTPKGQNAVFTDAAPAIEVLCFDQNAETTLLLKESGTCPAPGLMKVIFASPRSIPHLGVAIRKANEVVVLENVTSPKPRSVIKGHAAFEPGDKLEVVIFTEVADLERAKTEAPTLTVHGAQ